MARLLALIVALIAAAVIGWRVQQPPKPAPADAPATAFSAARALADVRAIGAVPHPTGSAANHAVRDHLLARMAALGLSPEVRPGRWAFQSRLQKDFVAGAEVENLVGVLPGRDRAAPALALMAHYDSVPGSPGAADDAAGVASALEIVRAIKARGVPARDVIVLLTDGEELGLIGAGAFFNRDPLAKRIGFILNLEARGSAGRVQMFQTGAGDGEAIRLLRQTATRPQSSSLSVLIYEYMPNDTDFTLAKRAGVGGLNYAFVGRQFDYHAPTSTPATLDLGTLQDLGQQVLATAAAAAFAPALPGKAPDVVYSQVFGNLLLAYPPAGGWLVLIAAAALIAFAVVRARRRERFPWTDPARGFGAGLFAVVGGMTLLHFARRATGAALDFDGQRHLLAQVTRWEIALLLIGVGFLLIAAGELARARRQVAFLPLAAGLAGSLFGGFDPVGLGLGLTAAVIALASYGRPVSRPGAWAGVLLLGLVLALAAQVVAAPAAFIFAWPLALAALAAAVTDLSVRRSVRSLAALAVIATLGLGWIAGYAHGAFVSIDLVEVMAISLAAAALLVWPLAQPAEGAPPERLLGFALLLVGLVVTASVRFNDPFTARYPQASHVAYQLDQDLGRAWLVSTTPQRPAWAEAVLRSGGGGISKLKSWVWRAPVDAAPAPFLAAPAPRITFAKQPDGSLRLHAAPPPGARTLTLGLTSNTPAVLETAGEVPVGLWLTPGKLARVRWTAAPQGVDLVIRPVGPGRMTVAYDAVLERWPAAAPPLPKRPPQVMAFGDSDATHVTGTRRIAW